jgi:hypothetical protein
MITDTQIKRATRFATPVVALRFGDQEAQAILLAMKTNYQALDSEVPSFKSPFNQMTLKIAVDTLAFY